MNPVTMQFDLSARTCCTWCGKLGASPCNRADCQEFDREMYQSFVDDDRQERRQAAWYAIKKRAKSEPDWELNRAERWFYTAKFLLCLLLRLSPNDRRHGFYKPSVRVAEFGYQQLYAGWECYYSEVGHGIFRQWWAFVEKDGDWNM